MVHIGDMWKFFVTRGIKNENIGDSSWYEFKPFLRNIPKAPQHIKLPFIMYNDDLILLAETDDNLKRQMDVNIMISQFMTCLYKYI